MSYEWTTTLVIRHAAGSREGAAFQVEEWRKLIADTGSKVVMTGTKPGSAAEVGTEALLRFLADDDAEESP